MKTKTMYMHTLDGKPASFDGEQIMSGGPVTLAKSLRQIKREQEASHKFREPWAWMQHGYDYVLVKVPTGETA